MLLLTLSNAQIIHKNTQIIDQIDYSRTGFNLEELKVRWKKAALENCPGVPCLLFTVPGVPISVTAFPGNSQATVIFNAPSSNGGSPITGYIVTSNPENKTSNGTVSPITIAGLTNGTTYSFTVTAINAVGNSPQSNPSNGVIPLAACSVGAASSSPSVTQNTVMTNITHSTTVATGIGTAAGLPSGVTANWAGNIITISGTPTATGTFNYSIPLTGTGCSSLNATGTITVSAPACSVSAASSSPSVTQNTVMTNITHSTTVATGIGTAAGLPSGVTANWAGNIITISGTPTATGTFNYSIPLTGTGCSSLNATGTIIVTVAPFVCGTSNIVDIDGNNYPTISIGTQCWMQKNLSVTKYNDGSTIPLDNTGLTLGTSGTWAVTTGAMSVYANNTSNVSDYGYLYNWYAATDSRKICPLGWHIPTDAEWTDLLKTVDNTVTVPAPSTVGFQSTSAGARLKSTDATFWTSTSTGTDNSSGFTALPAGFRNTDGTFRDIKDGAFFWSSTENTSVSSTDAWSRMLFHNNNSVIRDYSDFKKTVGGSLRCLKD